MALVLFLSAACVAKGREDGLLFHASLDVGAEADYAEGEAAPVWPRAIDIGPGRVGGAASLRRETSTLAYRMAGNAFVTAGTIGFFWRLDEPVDHAEYAVADLGCFQKLYFGRWLRLYMAGGRLNLQFFDSHFSPRRTRFSFLSPEPGRWYHVAVAWDQSRGVAVYVDGERIRAVERPWFLDANVNHLGLGQGSSSYSPTGRSRAARNQSFDEVRVYDRWLADADIAVLAGGDAPAPGPSDTAGLLRHRRAVFGWESPEGMPVLDLASSEGLALRQVGVADAVDVRKLSMGAFDGQRATAWTRSGYTDGGQLLEVRLAARERIHAVQWFARGAFSLEGPGEGEWRPLFRGESDEPRFARGLLEEAVSTERLRIRDERGDGHLMSAQFIGVNMPAAAAAAGRGTRTGHTLRPAGGESEGSPEGRRMRREFPAFDRTLYAAAPASDGGGALFFPAMRAVHLLGPPSAARRGWGAFLLDLRLTRESVPRVLRVEVIDPLNYNRRAFAADLALRPGGENRLQLGVDLRDLVLPPGTRPWIVLTFDRDVHTTPNGARAGFQWLTVEEAAREFFPDQFVQAREVFSWLSESRPWGWPPELVKWLGYLHNILRELRELRPDDPALAGYWQWIHPGEPKPRVDLPGPPEGMPAWAFYWDRAVPKFKQAAYWWIDHRMTEAGEFGALDGINDDTCLIQDWAALHLMRGPDVKLQDAVRRVADNSWNRTMSGGLGRRTDPLHHYEWGINAQCLSFLTEPGCPVAMERMMATARTYERLTVKTGEGRRHFISRRYGHQGIETSGPDGWDAWGNALTLQPAMLIAAHNGNEIVLRVLKEWVDAMMERSIELEHRQRGNLQGVSVHSGTMESRLGGQAYGFFSAVLAVYELTGDPAYLDFLGRCAEVELALSGRPGRTTTVLGRVLADTSADALSPGRRDRLRAAAGSWAPDERLWVGSLHNSAYRPLDLFYFAWQATGGHELLDEGMRLTLNDMTWSLPLLTEAGQSTDRVWLPQRLANRIALGDLAILRNELFPMHAVSWEEDVGRIAPLVLLHDARTLHVRIHNTGEGEAAVGMRIRRLHHGRYRRSVVRDGAGAQEDEVTLAPHDVMPLRVAPRGWIEVRLDLEEEFEDTRRRPDLAVTDRDAAFDEARGMLTVRVHNIGAAPTGPFELVARQGGRILLRREMESIDAPLDLHPRNVQVEILLHGPGEPVTVEADPRGSVAEIMTVNNRAVIDVRRLQRR